MFASVNALGHGILELMEGTLKFGGVIEALIEADFYDPFNPFNAAGIFRNLKNFDFFLGF